MVSTFVMLATAMCLSLIQRETLAVPPWTVQFVDQSGKPFSGLPIEQSWQDYSFESDAHTAEALTNDVGVVEWPPRYSRASLMRRLIGRIMNSLGGVHASFVPASWINQKCSLSARGPSLPIMIGGELPTRIVLGQSSAEMSIRPECARHMAQARQADMQSNTPLAR